MSCFPRFLHPRKTRSFNPAEDENLDTLLDTKQSVQIGRYARREETPVFPPKNTALLKQQQQQQQLTQQQQNLPTSENSPRQSEFSKSTNNNNNNNNSNNTNYINNNSTNNNNTNNNSSNNITKKFISNKQANSSHHSNSFHKGGISTKLQNANSISSNSINGSNGNSNNNNTNTTTTTTTKPGFTQNPHPKLKPVKQRRPTALPYEAPSNLETNTVAAVTSEDVPPTATAPTAADADAAAVAANGDVTTTTLQQNGYASDMEEYTISTPTTPTPTTPTPMRQTELVKFFICHSDDIAKSQNAHNQQDLMSLNTQTSNKSCDSPTTPDTLYASKDYHRHFSNEKSVTDWMNESQRSIKIKIHPQPSPMYRKTKSEATLVDYHIPVPPPLPPTPVTPLSPSASLMSLKSAVRMKKSKAKLAAENAASLEVLANDWKNSSINGNEENLEITKTSLNGRDSGVQVEDNLPTPTDSVGSNNVDSPQSRRAEGGLIHMRSNLPVHREIEIEFIDKDENTRNLIRTAIEKNDFLNNYMDSERKEMVIGAMSTTTYEKDSFIINENEEGSEIFVSEEGSFEVIKNGKVIGMLGPATVFGELAILYNAKRFASIKAITFARVWKIDRETFRTIMVISGSRERQENLNFLRSAPFLKDLSVDVLDRVVDLLQRKFYETNTCIVREGEVGNEFFIIRGGTVTIKKKNEYDIERVVDRRKRGDYFGEQALLNADCRQASVYADAPGTEVLKLDREAFISYMGTIPQLREKPIESDEVWRGSKRKSEFVNEYAAIELGELKKIATLGAGAFGRVDLVTYQEKTFALKIIKKIDVVKQDQIDHVYSEKHVMMKCSSSPFIIELYKTFRNDKFVYFLMEACMGGDVWTVMSQRRFFDEKTARFIAGCVVEAFDFLHTRSIIYRDLKPENLMLTTDGYCKLVDFGFAKHVPPHQKTNTFAGTPEYVAPEIILDRGHDRAVDYWALGILIFELLVGKTPFRGQNQIKIYQQILGGIDVIQMPSKIPKSAQSLIKQLCKQLPVERLGYQRKGIQDIKKHSWFYSLDWQKLKTKTWISPIKRPINSNIDIQYFVPCGPEHDHDPPDETSGWDVDF